MSNPSFDSFFKAMECVGFFGLGKSNRAVLSLLPKNKKVILRSEGKIKKNDIPRGVKPIAIYEGASALDYPREDILFFSPSVRRERTEISDFLKSGVIPCSDFELFSALNEKPIFSVTGSDGKSTTATLAAALLSTEKSTVNPIGNVGTPFVKSLLKKRGNCSVAEISSFSLRYAVPHSKRAVVTNITPNHLNWHKDFEEYKQTKLSLLDNAEETVISADDPYIFEYSKGKFVFAAVSYNNCFNEFKKAVNASVYYTAESGKIKRNGEEYIPLSALRRQEIHNIKNLLSALALTDGLVTKERAIKVSEEFSGLPHRLEETALYKGVRYINSSIDTTPARCSESLSSFDNSVILILGGRSKGGGYDTLRPSLSRHVKLAVITGENRDEIREDIRGSTECAVIEDFEDAVLYAASVAKAGDTVLLSPASTSYDAFGSFEERGDKFKEIVLNFIKYN